MRHAKTLLRALLVLTLAALPAAWTKASASGTPDVGDPYQTNIERAWQESVDGRNPSSSCAGIKGRTMASTDAMQGVIDSMAASGDTEAALTEALGSIAEEAMTEEGLQDPKRVIENRLDSRTRELCPDFADVILR